MPALDDSVITQAEVEREDTAAVGAGLDVLEEPDRVRDPWWRRLGSSIVPPILALVVVLVIWEIVYLLKLKPEVMLPSPAAVWDELVRLMQGGQARAAGGAAVFAARSGGRRMEGQHQGAADDRAPGRRFARGGDHAAPARGDRQPCPLLMIR